MLERKVRYDAALTAEDKSEIQKEVKETVRDAGYFFVELEKGTNVWSELTENQIRLKTRQALTSQRKEKKHKVKTDIVVQTPLPGSDDKDSATTNVNDSDLVVENDAVIVNSTEVVEIDLEERNVENEDDDHENEMEKVDDVDDKDDNDTIGNHIT